jgi:mono/diheme cytochrome c family protein
VRLIPLSGYALLGALSLAGQAPPARSITAGVYSAGQAARGQALYKAQCASCHGNAMEGSSGPPLVGDTFLSDWSAKSLANLVDKIQKTMPYDHPATLSRSQSTDLAAYVVQTDKFPAGQAELSDAALAQIVFPTVRSSAAPTSAGGTSLLPPKEILQS